MPIGFFSFRWLCVDNWWGSNPLIFLKQLLPRFVHQCKNRVYIRARIGHILFKHVSHFYGRNNPDPIKYFFQQHTYLMEIIMLEYKWTTPYAYLNKANGIFSQPDKIERDQWKLLVLEPFLPAYVCWTYSFSLQIFLFHKYTMRQIFFERLVQPLNLYSLIEVSLVLYPFHERCHCPKIAKHGYCLCYYIHSKQ